MLEQTWSQQGPHCSLDVLDAACSALIRCAGCSMQSLLFFDADKHNLRVQYSLTMPIAKPCTGGQLFWWISVESFIESGRFFSSGDRRSYSWKTLLRPRTLEVTLM